jgi:hypothetical protein
MSGSSMIEAASLAAAVSFGAIVLPSTALAQWVEPDVQVIREVVGTQADSLFGFIVKPMGDVNGDGVPDFVAAAPFFDSGSSSVGQVSCHSGANGATLWFRRGNRLSQILSFSVETIGDLTADGVPEVAAGGPWNAGLPGGKVEIINGATGALIHTFSGANEFDTVGYAVAADGDFDGDGVNDLAIGVVGIPDAWVNSGRVEVYSTATFALIATIDPINADETNAGTGLAYLGDVNGDGRDDLAFGVRIGDFDPPGRIHVVGWNGGSPQLLHTIDGLNHGGAFDGDLMEASHDFDGDGIRDLFFGEWSPSRGHLFSGADGSLIRTLDGDSDATLFGSGRQIDDVSGDGVPDLIVGARSSDVGNTNAGKVFLYSGADGSLLRTITSTTLGYRLGSSVGLIGDMNGDGAPDLLIGASGTSFEGSPLGRVFIIAGEPAEASEVCPGSFTRLRGLGVSGTVDSLCGSDDDRLVTRPDVFLATFVPPVQIEVEGASVTTSPSSMRLRIESSANSASILQRVRLFNFETNAYETIDSRTMPTSDGVVEVELSGDVSRFVSGDGTVRALIQCQQTNPTLPPTWRAGIDEVRWTLGGT